MAPSPRNDYHDLQHQQGGIRFDPTVNLGHILTFVGFLVAIFVSWSTLDKRVTMLEESKQTQMQIDKSQDALLQNNMSAIRDTLAEIKGQIAKLSERR